MSAVLCCLSCLLDGTAEFLIRMVVGAEGVAVTEQGGCAEQVDNGVLGQ